MQEEIKEILDRLFVYKNENDEMARCFEERKKMADYITNLREENERLNNIIDELEKEMNKDTLSYIETQNDI